MIYGNGVDNIELSRIEKALNRNPKFAQRVLTENELAKFMTLSGQRQIEFLGGRWAWHRYRRTFILSRYDHFT